MYNLVQSGCIVDRIGLLIPRRKIIDDFGHWIELVFFYVCVASNDYRTFRSEFIYCSHRHVCHVVGGWSSACVHSAMHCGHYKLIAGQMADIHSFHACSMFHVSTTFITSYRVRRCCIVCVCVFRPALHLTLEQTMNTADSYGKRPSSMQIDILANHIIDHISSTPLLWRGCRNSTLCIIIELIAVRTHTYQRLKQFPFVCG